MENQVIAYNVINRNVTEAANGLLDSVKTMISLGGSVQEYSATSGGKYTADRETATISVDDKTTLMITVLRHK